MLRFRKYAVIALLSLTLIPENKCLALSIYPGVFSRLEVTDNLFLTPENQDSEIIVTFGPTLSLFHESNKLNLELRYSYEVYRFMNEPNLNERDSLHFGRMDATAFPDSPLNIQFQSEARVEAIDSRVSDGLEVPTVNTTQRYSGLIRPRYRFELGSRHEGEIAYSFEKVEYDAFDTDETESNKVELLLERRHSSQMRFLIEGFYENFQTLLYPDYFRNQGLVGGVWNPNRFVEISAKGGVSWFELKDNSRFKSGIYDGDLRAEIGRRNILELSYRQDYEHTTRDGLYKYRRGEASFSRSGRFEWVLSYRYQDEYYVFTEREVVDQGGYVETTYGLTERIDLRLEGNRRQLEFKPVAEKVDRSNVSATLTYSFRENVSLGCRYLYRTNDSDIDTNDYEENRAYCEIRLAYGLVQ